MQYIIDIDEQILNAVADACANVYGYQEEVPVLDEDGKDTGEKQANPDSKIDFLRKRTAMFWTEIVQANISRQAEALKAQQMAQAQQLMDISISQN